MTSTLDICKERDIKGLPVLYGLKLLMCIILDDDIEFAEYVINNNKYDSTDLFTIIKMLEEYNIDDSSNITYKYILSICNDRTNNDDI